jgi:hypothetical protein
VRFLRAFTRLQWVTALALFGIVLALVPLGLDAIGYKLGPQQGYAILSVAGVLFVAAVVVFFWPVVRAAWSWLRRDEVLRKVENERGDLRAQLQEIKTKPRDGTGATPEPTIELGETTPLFLLPGKIVPMDDAERRPVFLPQYVTQAGEDVRSKWIKEGRTLTIRGMEFEDCDIYGPVVLVLAEGSFSDTFQKCEWEEEWGEAFWPHSKRGRYVGAIGVQDSTFRRCKFTGVAVVVEPEEYGRLYRRFTGDLDGP